jgi:hypothetical protein
MGDKICEGRVLVGKPRELGKPRHRWEHNLKVDEKVWLAEDRDRWRALVDAVMHFPAP